MGAGVSAVTSDHSECSVTTDLGGTSWNDIVSSIYVNPGCEMELWRDSDPEPSIWEKLGGRGGSYNQSKMGGTFTAGRIWNLPHTFNGVVYDWDNALTKFK